MKPGLVLLDSNVWLDYYLNRNYRGRLVVRLMDVISAHGSAIAVTNCICKDVFYIIAMEIKRANAREGLTLDDASAKSMREVAWGCLRDMVGRSVNIPGSSDDPLRALTLRELHDDFEDNLLVSACESNDVRLIVSSDALLQRHSPVKCMSIETATEYLSI